MQQLMNCTKLSLESPQFKELFKYLVQILIGMGNQLNFLWSSSNFEQKPVNLGIYFNAIYQLVLTPQRLHSYEAITLWNSLLQNEFVCEDTDVKQLIEMIAQVAANSFLLLKFKYSSMAENFDDEEEFNKFAQKYRGELGKMIKFAAKLNTNAFVQSANDWAVKILNETSQLATNDLSGYDPDSFLYLCWDALVFLWNNLTQVFITYKINIKFLFRNF